MNGVALALYRFLILPVAVVLIPFFSLFHGKIREGFRLRRQRWKNLQSSERPLWIHAASGEFEYAKAVIREFKLLRPHVPVVVTYFSPTFAGAVRSFPGVERALPLPLDLPGPCRSFLKRLNPRLLLIARTDLWPEMLTQCGRNGIDVQLFSYTQKLFSNAFKRWFTRWTLSRVNKIYCVTDTDQRNLALARLTTHGEVLGDTRYDQVAFRLQNPKPIAPALQPSSNTAILVAGSTWAEDEAVLLPALQEHLKNGTLKLVLVPHEPTPSHIKDLTLRLKALQLGYSLYSEGRPWEASPVLLVDTTGYLAELYLWGDFAFVGGSFKKTVHSVMEALGAGCYTFVGPKHANNREAIEFSTMTLGDHPGVDVVADAKDLQAKLSALIESRQGLERSRAARLAEFNRRLGASRKLAERVAQSYF